MLPEAELVDVRGAEAPLELCLDPAPDPVNHLTVRFETPTELKADGHAIQRPEFGVLAARIRDRISTLRALYDDGPLTIDGHPLGAAIPAIHEIQPDNSGPGEIYPSYVDVPTAGCWQFDLHWATSHAQVELTFA